jgi:signal transduction histidine kinase
VRLSTAGEANGVWDGDRLTQLVSNLVGNALAHGNPKEPVLLRVDGRGERHVVMEIHNAGAIPPELQPVIFEPFRSTSTRKEEGSSGLGLGLYISQQIALAHRGTIDMTSSDADGTRFIVRLPRTTA